MCDDYSLSSAMADRSCHHVEFDKRDTTRMDMRHEADSQGLVSETL